MVMVKVMACVQHYRRSKGIVACLALCMVMLIVGLWCSTGWLPTDEKHGKSSDSETLEK